MKVDAIDICNSEDKCNEKTIKICIFDMNYGLIDI